MNLYVMFVTSVGRMAKWMVERVDLLGRHYNVFIKECRRKLPALEKMNFAETMRFVKLVNDYLRGDKMRKNELPANIKIRRAIEHNSRY